MAVNIDVRRLAQQRIRVTEFHLRPLPKPPVGLLRFPGAMEWWKEMEVGRELDQQAIYQALLNKATGDDDDQGEAPPPDCCDTLTAALAAEASARAAEDTAINVRIDNLSTGETDDTLSWMNL